MDLKKALFLTKLNEEKKKIEGKNAVSQKQAENYFAGLDILVNGILTIDPFNIMQGLEILHRAFSDNNDFIHFIDMQGIYTCAVVYYLKEPQRTVDSKFKGFAYNGDRKAFCFNAYRKNQSRDCKTLPENAIPLFNEGDRLSDCIIKALGKIAIEPAINKIFDGEIDQNTFDNAIKFIDRIKKGTVKIAESPAILIQPDLSIHKELRRISHDNTKTTEMVERLAAKTDNHDNKIAEFEKKLKKAPIQKDQNKAEKWSEEKYTPYQSLRKHAEKCGAKSDAIFKTSQGWKELLNSSLQQKAGKYIRRALPWDKLLPLVQSLATLNNQNTVPTIETLKKKYRMH
jgi:hypothetical protein